MKYLITLVLIVSIKIGSNAQTKTDSLLTMNDLNNLTVMLYQPVGDIIGSATIVKHNNKFYLLTANHVANLMTNGTKIIFRGNNDIPVILNLSQFLKKQVIDWLNHPVADLSIIEIFPFDDNVKNRLENCSLPSYLILSSQQAPSSDFECTYLGYPVIDLKLKHFSSLFFNCHVASGLITQKRLDNNIDCDFFYLDNPGMEGCSGSGVYISVKTGGMFLSINKTLLVGVVHGTKGDRTGGKLAVITPGYYIWDLLNKLR